MPRPDLGFGLRHVALAVRDLSASEYFYVELLGMQVEWRPDPQNLYLTSGGDNLALHQVAGRERCDAAAQCLDHIGFFCATPQAVDDWFAWLRENGVRMRTEPRDHRDGARSFYCDDPDGIVVQFIHHPPLNAWEEQRLGRCLSE
jgi:catechol 2,3-dioxygenase-like lactoylglutathione lyase family enzyme